MKDWKLWFNLENQRPACKEGKLPPELLLSLACRWVLLLSPRAPSCPVTHALCRLPPLPALGASGGIELVVCALTINRGVIAPTINLENPDPDCDLDYTPNVARDATVDVAMSNSFGFGGHNASLVLGRLS